MMDSHSQAIGAGASGAVVVATETAVSLDDRERLQGSWSVISAERNGCEAPDILDHQLVVDGDAFAIRSNGDTLHEGTITLGPTHDPHTIDFTIAKSTLSGKAWRGIYQFEGDLLRICDNAVDTQKPRPAGFTTTADSGCVQVVFTKDKRRDQ
jgi:uncharacterized protein (TIGR03067 family)